MKLENLERAKGLIFEIEEYGELLSLAKSADPELRYVQFVYQYKSSDYTEKPSVKNKAILNKLHDLYILELELEIDKLKAELQTL